MDKAFYSGLDLGQAADYSALVVAERTTDPAKPGRGEASYAVRHLHRWKLGTSYPAIVADIVAMFSTPQLINSTLIIDATGVGRAVVDMIKDAKPRARVKAYTITCGLTPSEEKETVPKKDLCASVQAVIQSKRLKIAKELELAEVLGKELENFRVKVTPDRNETFASFREGDHDDLVLALALAVWFADRHPASGPQPYATVDTPPLARLPGGVFETGGLPGDFWDR